jgi:hypothetical protein
MAYQFRKASELFLTKGNQNNATLEHDGKLDGLSVVESWIIDDTNQDKSRKYGFDLPNGTWMVSMKVYDDDVWSDYVKTGKVKGFSIEGHFADAMERPRTRGFIAHRGAYRGYGGRITHI